MPRYIIEQVFGPDEPLPPSTGAAPPGLLLSLGDGGACEVTVEMIAKALWPVSWEDANARTRTHIERRASDLINGLIQQAQEKR